MSVTMLYCIGRLANLQYFNKIIRGGGKLKNFAKSEISSKKLKVERRTDL